MRGNTEHKQKVLCFPKGFEENKFPSSLTQKILPKYIDMIKTRLCISEVLADINEASPGSFKLRAKFPMS